MSSGRLDPWRGEWSPNQAAHLLRRAGLGASRAELQRAADAGLDASVDRLLAPDGHDAALEGGIRHLLATGKIETLQAWWVSLMLGGGAPLLERVTLMWHDHFATSFDKVADVRMMHRQNVLLRERGLGDFRVLLAEVSRDPAMLVWLDGGDNRKGRPNENFAREVMELFALGIGNYDETDVQQAARAFTGWGTQGRAFRYRAADHDGGEKHIFGHAGEFDGEQALALILDHPACARHIARRLLEEFVGPDAGDDEVGELAAVLVANEWQIGATLAQLLRSNAFHERASQPERITSPVEFAIGTCRVLGVQPSPQEVATALERMGQALFRPPSVKGWDGGRAWINASTWLARHNLAAELVERAPSSQLELLFGSEPSAETLDAALSILLPGGCEPAYRASLIAAARRAAPELRLHVVTALVLTSPEYHLL